MVPAVWGVVYWSPAIDTKLQTVLSKWDMFIIDFRTQIAYDPNSRTFHIAKFSCSTVDGCDSLPGSAFLLMKNLDLKGWFNQNPTVPSSMNRLSSQQRQAKATPLIPPSAFKVLRKFTLKKSEKVPFNFSKSTFWYLADGMRKDMVNIFTPLLCVFLYYTKKLKVAHFCYLKHTFLSINRTRDFRQDTEGWTDRQNLCHTMKRNQRLGVRG